MSEFEYQFLKSSEISPPEGWFGTPWFDDWFGPDESFAFTQSSITIPEIQGGSFDHAIEGVKVPVIQEGSFEYRKG